MAQTSLTYKGSPRPSPRLYRSSSRGSQRSSWRLKNRRRNGDKTSLVVDSLSDSADDVDDDAFSSSQNSQSPTLHSPGVPVSPGVVNQRWAVICDGITRVEGGIFTVSVTGGQLGVLFFLFWKLPEWSNDYPSTSTSSCFYLKPIEVCVCVLGVFFLFVCFCLILQSKTECFSISKVTEHAFFTWGILFHICNIAFDFLLILLLGVLHVDWFYLVDSLLVAK